MTPLARITAALDEMRARHDRALDLRPPVDDVPDYTTGYRDALHAVHEALTTNTETRAAT